MAKRLVIDPITRIEGHLRIEAEVGPDNKVAAAYSSGTMVRGIEIILRGRDPREAWAFTQRACGVCTTVHAFASIRSVEDALGIKIPAAANLMRNMIIAQQYVHDHVMHFYHLHALDWVNVVAALKADPNKTAEIQQSISPWPNASPGYFSSVQKKIQAIAQSGQLSIFANGYWGHPAYKLPPEVDLLAVAHYLEALDWQKDVVKIHTILGGKNPHPNFVVGGVPMPIDLNSDTALNASPSLHHQRQHRPDGCLRGPGVPARSAGHRAGVPGLCRPGRGAGQLPDLGRVPRHRQRRRVQIPRAARADPEPRSQEHHGARPARLREDEGICGALLVPVRWRRRRRAASVAGRDDVRLHRAQAALRSARGRRQVFLAESAALERHGGRGRSVGACAGDVCLRQPAGRGADG